jgi:hypothetical protein
MDTLDLAELLTGGGSQTKQLTEAPDAAADPQGAMDFFRAAHPMNDKVASDDLPECSEGSERIRLRRVIEQLGSSGLLVSGIEPASYQRKAQISFRGTFDRSGTFGNATASIADGPDKEQTTELVQGTLQGFGFAAVVTMEGTVEIIPAGGDAEKVAYVEVGGCRSYRSYRYNRNSQLAAVALLQWQSSIEDISESAIESWISDGYSIPQVQAWLAASVRSSYEAKMWDAMKQTPQQAAEWQQAGLVAYRVDGWLQAGKTPRQAGAWAEIGLSEYSAAEQWMKEKRPVSEAAKWSVICSGATPDDIRYLLDGGVTGEDAVQLREAGCSRTDLRKLEEWTTKYKIELDESLQWAKLGTDFIGPGKRGRWHKAGYSPQDITLWQKALGTRSITIDQVRAKLASGYDPQAAQEWADVHPSLASSRKSDAWIEAGMKPSDAKAWVTVSADFCDYDLVLSWTDAGKTVIEAKQWAQAAELHDQPSLCHFDVVSSWMAADERCADPELTAKLMKLVSPDDLAQLIELLS